MLAGWGFAWGRATYEVYSQIFLKYFGFTINVCCILRTICQTEGQEKS